GGGGGGRGTGWFLGAVGQRLQPHPCARRSDRPKHRRASLRASVSSDRGEQRGSRFVARGYRSAIISGRQGREKRSIDACKDDLVPRVSEPATNEIAAGIPAVFHPPPGGSHPISTFVPVRDTRR